MDEGQDGDFRLVKINSNYEEEWSSWYGWSNDDQLYAVAQTPDGGYVLGGWADIDTAMDGVIVKVDSVGEPVWTRFYSGRYTTFYDIYAEEDGRILAVGYNHVVRPYLLIIDEAGEIISETIFNERIDGIFSCIKKTSDQGYILSGRTGHDGYLVKLDSEGRLEWESGYGGGNTFRGITEMNDGCLIAGSQRWVGGTLMVWMLKTDAVGNAIWSHDYEMGLDASRLYDLIELPDGGVLFVGEGIPLDFVIGRINAEGELLWSNKFNRIRNRSGYFSSVLLLNDLSYLIAGQLFSDFGGFLLVKTEPDSFTPMQFNLLEPANGDTVQNVEVNFAWQKSFDPNEDEEVAYTLWFGPDGDSIVVANTRDTSIVVNLDSILVDMDDISIIEWWVTAISPPDTIISNDRFNLTILPQAVTDPAFGAITNYTLSAVYPNPFNSANRIRFSLPEACRVSISVFDLAGRQVVTLVNKDFNAGRQAVIWNAEDITAGVYLVSLETSTGQRFTQKVILLK
ncbi:MAG: T9SS type A sorting domain-containing protein [Calditrichota bacterium]